MKRRSFLQWLGVASPAAKVINLYPEKKVEVVAEVPAAYVVPKMHMYYGGYWDHRWE